MQLFLGPEMCAVWVVLLREKTKQISTSNVLQQPSALGGHPAGTRPLFSPWWLNYLTLTNCTKIKKFKKQPTWSHKHIAKAFLCRCELELPGSSYTIESLLCVPISRIRTWEFVTAWQEYHSTCVILRNGWESWSVHTSQWEIMGFMFT